jgi:ParB/Sulfiredoxin domain
MQILEVILADITPYDGNPRLNDPAVDAVAASISEFGFLQPIVVDSAMVIVVGHTRFRAAQRLGLEKVPIVIAAHLTPEQIKAYRIADNATNLLAEWDYARLVGEIAGSNPTEYGAELREMFDLLGRECEAALAAAAEDDEECEDDGPSPEGLELGVNEYYDVIAIVCKNVKDWNRLVDVFELPRVKVRRSKLGLLRAVEAGKVLQLLDREKTDAELQDRDSEPAAGPEHAPHAGAAS